MNMLQLFFWILKLSQEYCFKFLLSIVDGLSSNSIKKFCYITVTAIYLKYSILENKKIPIPIYN